MSISLTVIIPTLNEGESIGPTIDQIPRDLPWLDVKVLIVDGNSTDNTIYLLDLYGDLHKSLFLNRLQYVYLLYQDSRNLLILKLL